MKKLLKTLTFVLLLIIAATSCSQNIEDDDFDENPYFYTDSGKKIYLQHIKDKILLTFTPDTNKEQIETIMGNYTSLHLIDCFNWFNDNEVIRFSGSYAAYYDIDKKPISLETIEFLKKYPEVASVTYLLKWKNGNNSLLGLQDCFLLVSCQSNKVG